MVSTILQPLSAQMFCSARMRVTLSAKSRYFCFGSSPDQEEDRQASERRELAQSRSGYVVLVPLALAPYLLGAVGFGNAIVFQSANADPRIGAVVQTSRGRVPHQEQPPGERGLERAAGCQSIGV